MPCNLICERFLKNIARWYGRKASGARNWTGYKEIYDDRVYDMRVLLKPGSLTDEEKKNYKRCGQCQIILFSRFKKCPCCGNSRLSILPYSNKTTSRRKGDVKRY